MKKISFLLLTLLLTCVVLSACGNKDKCKVVDTPYYIEKNQQFQKENQMLTDGVDCVFAGDSLTDWYPLADYYNEFTFVNRGISGDTSYGLLQRLDNIYQLHPKVVVILIGANNLSDCRSDIEKIVRKIKRNLPNTKIVMQSMYPIGAPCFGYEDWTMPAKELCGYLQKLCQKYDLIYADVYSVLADENGNPLMQYNIGDGLHVSYDGYKVVTDVLKPIILSLLEK